MNEALDIANDHVPSAGPGAMLARVRSDRGLSVADISAQLRYSPKQIEALEGDDYSRLPGTTFIRGMIRSYAKVLDTQAGPILKAFEITHVPAPVAVDLHAKRVPFPDGRARSTRVYIWLSVLTALLVTAVLYERRFGLPEPIAEAVRSAPVEVSEPQVPQAAQPAQAEQRSEPEVASNSLPSVATQPAPTTAVTAVGRLRFEFQKDAWVEVKERGGHVLIAQTNQAGTQTNIEGTPPFSLVIGNASNVRLIYGEKPVDFGQYIKVDVARFTLD